MLFWHVGGSVLLFRYLFRDPGVDLRFLAAGAIISDVIDKPIGRIIWADHFRTGRVFGHTLLFFAVVLAVAMVLTERGTGRRKQWVAFSVGIMFHLILDAMWVTPETLLWPVLGSSFPPGVEDYWAGLLGRIVGDPSVVLEEVAGLAYLVYLWRRAGLADPDRRERLRRAGIIVT